MILPAALNSLKSRLTGLIGGATFSGSSGSAVALVTADGRILKMSDPARRMFSEARRAETLAALFMPEDAEAIDRAVRSKALCRLEARARRPGGAAGNFEILLERRPDGRTAALLIDRTAEKLSLRRVNQEADRARAQSAESAVLLADLSHEMRTPLNAVIGFAETIERQTFGPVGHDNYAQYAEHIRMAGRHLLDLVNTVLDLSKIEADRFAIQRVAADPGAVAREAAALTEGLARDAGLRLTIDIADNLPKSFIDPRAVRQILLNLLSNAVKFTSDGEISLTLRQEDDEIVFIVKDDGVGMSAEALAAIGARFTSAHGSGVRGQGGAGLGLSLAISLAELHGGQVDLSSAPGEGLTATVRLPVGAAPRRERSAMTTSAKIPEDAQEPLNITQLDRIKAYRRQRPRADAA